MHEHDEITSTTQADRGWAFAIALAVAALAVVAACWVQAPGFNGSRFWFWPWRREPLSALRVAPLMLAGFVPLLAAQLLTRRGRGAIVSRLVLAALAAAALQLGASVSEEQPYGFRKIPAIVQDGSITSYHLDARRFARISDDRLLTFTRSMGRLHVHSRTHPPGPIVGFLAVIWLYGEEHSALIGGLLIALLAAGCVPATYGLARALGVSPPAAFEAACALALTPSLILMFPGLDQIYPLLSAALVGTWALALRGPRFELAARCGLALFVATFTAYNLLAVGAFMLGFAAWQLASRRCSAPSFAIASALVVSTCAGAYLLLWLWTGFDPIETFGNAIANQAAVAAVLDRPWPDTIPWDAIDFVRGAGWLLLLPAGATLLRAVRRRGDPLWLAALCFGQLAVLALSGLLPAEAARLWTFVLPLLAIPAGIELARWGRGPRLVAYSAMWIVLVVMHQTIAFLDVA